MITEKKNAWILESKNLREFLISTFKINTYGEIWLLNNNLDAITSLDFFNDLYLDLICTTYNDKIDAVKFVLDEENCKKFNEDETVLERFKNIDDRLGFKALNKFMLYSKATDQLSENIKSSGTWIFYVANSDIDHNGSIAMYRPNDNIFNPPGFEKDITIIWSLKQVIGLNTRLKKEFNRLFNDNRNFKYIKSIESKLRLKKGISSYYRQRKELRSRKLKLDVGYLPGDSVDILIVAALSEEIKYFLELFKESNGNDIKTHVMEEINSGEYYFFCETSKKNYLRIITVQFPDQGNLSSSLVTENAIQRYQPNKAIMIGVCGGDPKLTNLGDVIVAQNINYYERGSVNSKFLGFSSSFARDENQNINVSGSRLNVIAQELIVELNKELIVELSDKSHISRLIDEATILSGEKLIASESFYKKMGGKDRKTFGTEMEGAGFGNSCLSNSITEMLLIKGVMDHCNEKTRESHDKKNWKIIAAKASSKFCYQLINKL